MSRLVFKFEFRQDFRQDFFPIELGPWSLAGMPDQQSVSQSVSVSAVLATTPTHSLDVARSPAIKPPEGYPTNQRTRGTWGPVRRGRVFLKTGV